MVSAGIKTADEISYLQASNHESPFRFLQAPAPLTRLFPDTSAGA